MRGASWALWMRSYSGLYGSFSSSPSQFPLCSTFAMGNLCKLLLLLNCVSPLFSFLPSEYKQKVHISYMILLKHKYKYNICKLLFVECDSTLLLWQTRNMMRRIDHVPTPRPPWPLGNAPTYETTWILSIETLPRFCVVQAAVIHQNVQGQRHM